MDEISILGLDDRERWEAEHMQGGLPSQSWGYAWGLSASGFTPKLAVVRCKDARMLLPFVQRTWMGSTDIATIPGLSGASITPSSTAPLSLWREFAIGEHWVAGYIQLATTTNLHELPPDTQLVAHNAVFLFDLRLWDPATSSSRTVRRKVNTALQKGAVMVEDVTVLAESLKQLYPVTMRRLGAAQSFSAETLGRWAYSPNSIILGVQVNDIVEAVHLGHVAGQNAEWHIAATTDNGRSLAILIYWNAATHLRRRGVRFYNMGGGARIGDGVYRFKEWLGGVPTPLKSLRQIYDRNKYDELCERAQVSLETTTWFPPYRAVKQK